MIPVNKYSSGEGTVSFQKSTANEGIFALRLVRRSDLNFLYFPSDSKVTNAKCISFLIKPLENREVLTFYPEGTGLFSGNEMYYLTEYYDAQIQDGNEAHQDSLHKRDSPINDWHYHFLFQTDTKRRRSYRRKPYERDKNINTFLKKILEESSLSKEVKSRYYDQLAVASHYLSDCPFEPGLIFEDGSYVLNGGYNNTENEEVNYQRGPCRLYKRDGVGNST